MSFKFFNEIKKLNKHLIKLSIKVEQQVGFSIQSVSELNIDLANQVINSDDTINKLEIEIEEECLKVLALHQPVANDLRLIIAVIKINNDLERIADHAVYIAEKAIDLAANPKVEVPNQLFELSSQSKIMLRKALLAFVETDIQVANDVLAMGDEINRLSHDIFHNEVDKIKQNTDQIISQLDLLDISRQLKRIAQHATNIAEDTVFILKGDIIRHNS